MNFGRQSKREAMKLDIAVLKGDGIGPEVVSEAVKTLENVAKKYQHEFSFKEALVGGAAIKAHNNPLPEASLQLCKTSDAVLFGAVGHPNYNSGQLSKIWPAQGLLKLRQELDLFVNIRPVRAYEATISKTPLKPEIIRGTDFRIFRELSGGVLMGDSCLSEDGQSAFDTCSYTVFEIERIAKLAFEAAMQRKKKVTMVDKANFMATGQLWRRVCTEISKNYPEVELENLHVDHAAIKLIQHPTSFDIIVTSNIFGDILSDEAGAISGSLGLLPSASIGPNQALFAPVHGCYAAATGKGIANPLASILSAAMLLEHFDLEEEASEIYHAVERSLTAGVSTMDLVTKERFGTEMVGDFIQCIILELPQYGQFQSVEWEQSTII